MHQAAEILRNALRRLKRPEEPLDWLAAVWPVIVGKRLAAHSRPASLQDGILAVETREQAWLVQLEELSGTLRRVINHSWGGELVRQVRFSPASASAPGRPDAGVVGISPNPPAPAEPAPEHTPFIRRGAQTRRAK